MFDFAGNGDNQLRQKDRRSIGFLGCNIVITRNICWRSGRERKERIADGLGCCAPHDVRPKESWSSTKKSKCLVLIIRSPK